MRIAAGVGVKNEVELVERLISHLRSIGVDRILFFDMGSTDGTLAILEDHVGEGDFSLIRLGDADGAKGRAASIADGLRSIGSDWVLYIDADELPIPASGSLHDIAELDLADAIRVDRFNVPLTAAGPEIPDRLSPGRYEDLLLIVDGPREAEYLKRREDEPDLSWMRRLVAPRVLARPEALTGFVIGVHDIVPANPKSVRRTRASDLVIAHQPFTNRDRFHRKVSGLRRSLPALNSDFGPKRATHWRHWVALADQGLLDEEFDRMVFSTETVAELRSAGAIRSAAEVFADRSATVPEWIQR